MTLSPTVRWGALIVALAVVALFPAGSGAAEAPAEAANRQAATQDVEARLAALQLPPGSESVPGIPAGANPELNGSPLEPARPNLIDRTAWWRVPVKPSEVFAWIEGNLPPGSAVRSNYYGANFKTGNEFWGLELEWSPLGERVTSRFLQLTVSSLPSGATALRVDSQAVWISPHAASERIPAQARVLEVEWGQVGGPPRLVVTENTRFIAGVAAMMDALPVGQPGIRHCPRRRAGPTVDIRFLARPGASPLAEAAQELPPGGACNGMTLKIRGRYEPALEETGPVIRRLRKLR